MADNGRWFKLWTTALDDPSLDNLDIADFGRWSKLGALIKAQGKDGSLCVSEPSRLICSMMQLSTFKDMIDAFQKLPNITVTLETNATVTYKITWLNWLKYQGDWSGDRVRKFRSKNSTVKRPKKRREEKRKEESNDTAPPGTPVAAFVFDGKFMKVTKEVHSGLVTVYDEDLCLAEYKKADLWLFNNPNKRRKRIGQFMANWMENAVKRVKGNGIQEMLPPMRN